VLVGILKVLDALVENIEVNCGVLLLSSVQEEKD
jgi:hypothetical protein